MPERGQVKCLFFGLALCGAVALWGWVDDPALETHFVDEIPEIGHVGIAVNVGVFDPSPYPNHMRAFQYPAPPTFTNPLLDRPVRVVYDDHSSNDVSWVNDAVHPERLFNIPLVGCRLSLRQNLCPCNARDITGGGLPEIAIPDLRANKPSEFIPIKAFGIAIRRDDRSEIRSQLMLGRVLGDSVRPARYDEVPDKQDGSSERKPRCSGGWRYLFFNGICGPYLGIQIGGIMCVGLGFAILSVFGIRRALYLPDRKGRFFGWILFAGSVVLGLSFYGWGFLGHPLRIWGLA